MFDDGESEACPSHLLGPPFIHPVKPFKDSREVLSRDSNPIILHQKQDLLAFPFDGRNLNRSALGCILDGIVQKIDENLAQLVPVTLNGQIGRDFAPRNGDPFPLRSLADEFESVLDQFDNGNLFGLQLEAF